MSNCVGDLLCLRSLRDTGSLLKACVQFQLAIISIFSKGSFIYLWITQLTLNDAMNLLLWFLQHAAYPDLDSLTSYFGVYDGHGGKGLNSLFFLVHLIFLKSLFFFFKKYLKFMFQSSFLLSFTGYHLHSAKYNFTCSLASLN